MIRQPVRNVAAFLQENLRNEVETLEDAHRFIQQLNSLTAEERHFVQAAVSNLEDRGKALADSPAQRRRA